MKKYILAIWKGLISGLETIWFIENHGDIISKWQSDLDDKRTFWELMEDYKAGRATV